MSNSNLDYAIEMRDLYRNAEKAVLINQEYEIGGKKLKRANLSEIREGREYWEARVETLKTGKKPGARIISVTPGG